MIHLSKFEPFGPDKRLMILCSTPSSIYRNFFVLQIKHKHCSKCAKKLNSSTRYVNIAKTQLEHNPELVQILFATLFSAPHAFPPPLSFSCSYMHTHREPLFSLQQQHAFPLPASQSLGPCGRRRISENFPLSCSTGAHSILDRICSLHQGGQAGGGVALVFAGNSNNSNNNSYSSINNLNRYLQKAAAVTIRTTI